MGWLQRFWLHDAATPQIRELLFLHDHAITILILVLSVVVYGLCFILWNKFTARYYKHNQVLEVIWTITPALILIALLIPSLRVLYILDETGENNITLKAIGH